LKVLKLEDLILEKQEIVRGRLRLSSKRFRIGRKRTNKLRQGWTKLYLVLKLGRRG
jgi:hypothetical protein